MGKWFKDDNTNIKQVSVAWYNGTTNNCDLGCFDEDMIFPQSKEDTMTAIGRYSDCIEFPEEAASDDDIGVETADHSRVFITTTDNECYELILRKVDKNKIMNYFGK